MSDGYVVRRPDGTETPGTGGADAGTFLGWLSSLTASADVTASPYADPDVVALHRAGLARRHRPGLHDRARPAAAAARRARGARPRLARGPGLRRRHAQRPARLRDAGRRALGRRVPPSPAVSFTPSGSVDLATGGAPLRAALSDPAVSALVGAPLRGVPTEAATSNVVVRRQTALAEIAMTTLELPTTPRTIVIAPDTRWSAYGTATHDLVLAVAAAPFATPTARDARLTSVQRRSPRAGDYPEAARAAELKPGYLADVTAGRGGARRTARGRPGHHRSEHRAARGRAYPDRVLRVASRPGGGRSVCSRRSAARSTPRSGGSGRSPARPSPSRATRAPSRSRWPTTSTARRVGPRLTGTPATRFVAGDVPAVTLAPGGRAPSRSAHGCSARGRSPSPSPC